MIIEDKPAKNNNDWWAVRSQKLLEDQKNTWGFLKKNYESLNEIKVRSFDFEYFQVKLQFNPARIKSSSADVSPEAVENRECFLCINELPAEQNGLRYDKNFIILCNPYPIFEEHFTIVNRKHSEQTLIGHFDDLLNLSRDLGSKYSVYYNGPRCGASAPDHMHFQAGSKNATPLELEYESLKQNPDIFILQTSKISIRFFENHLRFFLSIESGNKGEILYAFKTFVKAYKKISPPKEEPMMNLSVSYDKDKWRVILFPRGKHRPLQFYSKGEDKLMISPAAVDLSGLIIVPRSEDFEKATQEDIVNVFQQVSLTKEYFEYLKKKLSEVF